MSPQNVLIDTDPAITLFGADVDDALAIFLALNSDELIVDGITTVFGNTHLNNSYRIAKEILKVAARPDIPVFKGAYNASWLGIRTPAVNFLINHIMEHPGEIILITLAPLTNIASAFLLEPRLAENLKAMVVMGGFLPSNFRNFLLQAEFNFSGDPHATQIVLDQKNETTIVGLDVTTQVKFKDAQYNALYRKKTDITQYLIKHLKSWLTLNKILQGGFNPHDPIAVAYLIQKNLFKQVKTSLNVNVSKKSRKMPHLITKKYTHPLIRLISNLIYRNGRVEAISSSKNANRIKFCTSIDESGFLKLLINRLTL